VSSVVSGNRREIPAAEAETESASPTTSTPTWHVVLAPWIYFWSPARAGRIAAEASGTGLVLTLLSTGAALAALVLLLALWSQTVQLPEPTVVTNPDGTVYYMIDRDDRAVIIQSMVAVWRNWHEHGPLGWAEAIFFGMFVLWLLLVSAGAWLQLPSVHTGGAPAHSFRRALLTTTAGAGLIIYLILLLAIPSISSALGERLSRIQNFMSNWEDFLFISIPPSVSLVLWWIGRAAWASRADHPPPDLPPRCENCGYDLSHRSSSELCTECGRPVAESFSPQRRPGSKWESNGATLVSFFATTLAVCCRPSRFYSTLRLRATVGPVRRFAGLHYIAIGIGAGIWIAVAVSLSVDPDEIYLASFFSFFIPLCGWFTHRVIGALVATWWFVRGKLPDPRWAAAIVGYETAYLWWFCLYNGFLISTFFVSSRWMSEWLGTDAYGKMETMLGIPPEPAAILIGNGLLCLAWLWRYRTALYAVRWSNV
jgi:hypothetical protein